MSFAKCGESVSSQLVMIFQMGAAIFLEEGLVVFLAYFCLPGWNASIATSTATRSGKHQRVDVGEGILRPPQRGDHSYFLVTRLVSTEERSQLSRDKLYWQPPWGKPT